jgi:hypothetical protein
MSPVLFTKIRRCKHIHFIFIYFLQVLWVNLKERNNFLDLLVPGQIILKWILKITWVQMTVPIFFVIGELAGRFKSSDNIYGSNKFWEAACVAAEILTPQTGLSSLDLISYCGPQSEQAQLLCVLSNGWIFVAVLNMTYPCESFNCRQSRTSDTLRSFLLY